jgi:hypothetical protein
MIIISGQFPLQLYAETKPKEEVEANAAQIKTDIGNKLPAAAAPNGDARQTGRGLHRAAH